MMEFIERSSIFFSMVDTLTGIPKIYSKTARFVEKLGLDPNASPEYYVYYKFTTQDTNRVGRYEGQFVFINDTSSGNILTILTGATLNLNNISLIAGTLVLPIREPLFINVVESNISNDLPYDNCYVLEYNCCVTPFPSPLPSQTPYPKLSNTPTPTPTPPPTFLSYSSWLINYPTLTGAETNRTADPDGDGFDNNKEYAFDGNPTVGTPSLLSSSNNGSSAVFRFTGLKGAEANYTVQNTTNLSTTAFAPTSIPVTLSSDQTGLLLPVSYERREFSVPLSATNNFYRVIFNNQ